MNTEYLHLKWGTLKAWKLEQPRCVEIVKRYAELGNCVSAICQEDTPEQKQLICELIDVIDGPILNRWTGKEMTREEAKKYVTEYGKDTN